MTEKEPVPISRGVEIQTVKFEAIQNQARVRYKELIALSKTVEERIDIMLSKPSDETSSTELSKLFDQKHTLDDIGRELETLVLGAQIRQDGLIARWVRLEERLSLVEQQKDELPPA